MCCDGPLEVSFLCVSEKMSLLFLCSLSRAISSTEAALHEHLSDDWCCVWDNVGPISLEAEIIRFTLI